MAANVLPPRQMAGQLTDVDFRPLPPGVVVGDPEVFLDAEQSEYRTGGDAGHVAALLIEPVRVARRNAVADERQSRRAKRDQLMRIHRNVAGVPAAERRFGGAILQE